MGRAYSPTDSLLHVGWSAVGSLNAHETVDDSALAPANDADYVTALATETKTAAFWAFNLPAYYTSTLDYGDGTLGNQFSVGEIVTQIHASLSAAGPAVMNLRLRDLAGMVSEEAGTFTITKVLPAYEEAIVSYSVPMGSLLRDPAKAADLEVEVYGTAGNPAVNVRISRLFVRINDADCVGGTKARLGPAQGEPSYFCAICSEPHHLGKMIKPRNPQHPQYQRLVCADCYDEITQYETQDQGIKEGDFDFEGR